MRQGLITLPNWMNNRLENLMLTQKRLKEVLDYNPDTGVFTWKLTCGRKNAGEEAGCIGSVYGYRLIGINTRHYRAARLAWFYMHGKWPENEVDHINHNRLDDRIDNLRCVTQKDNCRNMSKPINNSSGETGVHFRKDTRKWTAYIRSKGKREYLGCFVTFFAACYARHAANVRYGFHPNHGK